MITVIILTKNEEKNILDCLETVNWADEIIVVDDYSQDRTVEIAKTLNLKNLKIYQEALSGDFSKQRNYGLSKARNEWTLFIDADERITPELRKEINDLLIEERNKSMPNGMYIKRVDYLWGSN